MVIQHPQAALTFNEIIKAWFVHAGRAYPVESVPAAIFNAAVLDLVPNWRMSPIYGEVLASNDIDLVTRWWILCGLVDAGKPMVLYGSREEAERALG